MSYMPNDDNRKFTGSTRIRYIRAKRVRIESTEFARNGLLARAGLQPGDVVKSVNGQAVTSEADLARLAQISATGQAIRGELVRDGKTVPIRFRATP